MPQLIWIDPSLLSDVVHWLIHQVSSQVRFHRFFDKKRDVEFKAYYDNYFFLFFHQGSVESDLSDAPFVPEVDLSDKPWFDIDNDKPNVEVEAARNLTYALGELDAKTRIRMGHRIEDMLQECKWESKNCNPMWVQQCVLINLKVLNFWKFT